MILLMIRGSGAFSIDWILSSPATASREQLA
jgi:hypothetical protein